MKNPVTAAIILSCLPCLFVAQASAMIMPMSAPTAAERYRTDVSCASMAVALKKDPGIAASDPAPDPAEVDKIVSDTHSIAITSGQALSKSPDQVEKDIDAGALPYLRTLGDAQRADDITAAEARLGKSLIRCAFSQLGHAVEDSKPAAPAPK